jgi:hypothetical protein
MVIAAAVATALLYAYLSKPPDSSATSKLKGVAGRKIIRADISKDATLVLLLARSTEEPESPDDAVALGPHSAQLVVNPKTCKNPRFWIRLVGATLVHINLVEDASKATWRGSFSIPVQGSYRVDARWYGCNAHENILTPFPEPVTLQAVGTDFAVSDISVFANGSSWTLTQGIEAGDVKLPDYIWKNPEVPAQANNFIKTSDSVVLKEGTVRQPNGFYAFAQLGNYELVCFMGSDSMANIRREFMSMRATIFRNQRPFKFHYYNISTFERPDRDWDTGTKARVRKCKHILVSLDDLRESVSQGEYKAQVTTFLKHLKKLIDDDTFPIIMFTVNEPPMQASNCHTPSMRRTSDHPCNDVLKHLFRPGSKVFPERVRLLDNTDLSLPQFDENRLDVMTVIALRVYVLVGKQVAEWRAMGQHGMIDGLHRNSTVEPNFKLIPYDEWN